MKIDVLDKGFVEIIDVLGSDLTVVNAARVSFGKQSEALTEADRKLIRYLARHKHYSPFRHPHLSLRIKAPEFVMRQWYKHVVGIETTNSYAAKDHAWNEISRRYVEVDEYYFPKIWRLQSESNKQASEYDENGDPIVDESIQTTADYIALLAVDDAETHIESLIEMGIAKEQAQMLLPLNFYTEVYWTASFQAMANFVELRDDPHAQWEIRQYAKAIRTLLEENFPETTEAWFGD